MSWSYSQSTGLLTGHGRTFQCYSGHGEGLNNPAMEAVHGVGPIPRGQWKMIDHHDSQNTGPYSITLAPMGHDAHGRSLFRLHGDNAKADHSASDGCIVRSPRADREAIWNSGDHLIGVVE